MKYFCFGWNDIRYYDFSLRASKNFLEAVCISIGVRYKSMVTLLSR